MATELSHGRPRVGRSKKTVSNLRQQVADCKALNVLLCIKPVIQKSQNCIKMA